MQRKQSSNPGFAILTSLKQMWEEGRQRTCSQENRDRIVKDMLAAVDGKFREVSGTILARDEVLVRVSKGVREGLREI